MNKKRLLKLADFLETVPNKAFDMNFWQEAPASKPEGEAPGGCGFSGCAMGWATHARLFRGLSFGPFTKKQPHPTLRYRAPTNPGTKYNFNAPAALFDISHSHSLQLFSPMRYPGWAATPKQVARRIRKFVESKGAIP